MQTQTQGTETSKYLEEKKSKEIPVVVASELGIALKSVYLLVEWYWKVQPKKVKVLYTKMIYG